MVLISLFASAAFAQGSTGAIHGSAAAGGLAVADAEVTVTNVETGYSRRMHTGADGAYLAEDLPPGRYQISVAAAGFEAARRQFILVSVGRDARVDFVLVPGGGNQTVVVVGEAPLVETRQTDLSGLTDEVQIRNLPVNGRSFDKLALLQPGVAPVRVANVNLVNGLTSQYSINGARPASNAFILDGSDLNNTIFNKTPGGVSGLLLGLDTIREFQVLTSSYSAEYGRAAGGIVHAVSRSGGNEFHGSLFEYLRNSALDAKNFFDRADAPIPGFKRSQFGFTLGGPILRDRTFFFASYEGLRERLGATRLITVPDEQARRGIIPDAGGATRTIPLTAPIVALLNLYPLPNGKNFGDGTASFTTSVKQPTGQNQFSQRLDHKISARDSVFVRYSFDDSKSVAGSFDLIPAFATDLSSRNQYLTISADRIISSNTIHNARVAYNRTRYSTSPIVTANLGNASPLVPGRPRAHFGRIQIRGLTGIGNDTGSDLDFTMNLFEIAANLRWTRGKHNASLGFQLKRIQNNDHYNFFFDGLLVYENLGDFLANRASRFLGVQPGADSQRGYRQTLAALYLQDQWQIRQRLTLNLGLRYEMFSVPTEVNGKLANLRRLLDPQTTVGSPLFKNPSWNDLSPRVGFAWDVFGSGKTSLRGGAGVFYDPILEYIFGYGNRIQPPYVRLSTIIRPPYPNPFQKAALGDRANATEFEPHTPSMLQFHLTLQQELASGLMLSLGYVGSRGYHLPRIGDINASPPITVLPNGQKVFAAGTPRPNPRFDFVSYISMDAQSFYNAFQAGLVRRFQSGLQFQTSYTLSKSIDEASGLRREFNNSISDAPPDYYDRRAERALSNFDMRHNFAASLHYPLPMRAGSGSNRFLGWWIQGWQVDGIASISSGFPFTANISYDIGNTVREGHRPNLKPGFSNNPVLGGPDRYFDVNAFEVPPPGMLGNLGRNTLIGPGYASLDLALSKSAILRENAAVQFRAEFFNLLNRPNFASPQNTSSGGDIVFNSPAGIPVGNAGQIFSTVGTSRQIQLVLKLIF